MRAALGRIPRGSHWIAFFGAVIAAWIALYAMAIPADLRAASRVFGAEFWDAICRVTPDAAGFGRMVVMWAIMSVAMMLPTAAAAFATYDDLGHAGARTAPLRLWAGYIAVWLGFAVAAAGLQMALFSTGLTSAYGDSRSAALSAVLLALAGFYQFTALKHACLNRCRAPMTFFLTHWADGPWRMGLRLGLACLGCCWALMLLALVGGVMNLAFMGLATVIMTLEKLPRFGRILDKPLGGILLAGAGVTALAGL